MNTLGADIGGTFTDLVWWTGSELRRHKVLSTRPHPELAVLAGIGELGANLPETLVIHGSTVATNAFLERKGARVALLATAGFGDVIEIGRQNRTAIYDPRATKPEPLVPRDCRLEVRERMSATGETLVPLDKDEVRRVVEAVAALKPEAVAICLLHAYAYPQHERMLAEALRPLCPFVYLSCEVDPAYREYERTSTTVLNAYVAPLVADYVQRLSGRLAGPLRLMGAHGARQTSGLLKRPAGMILSGPAGGVVGAKAMARVAGIEQVITLDMGGTSTDVTLIAGEPLIAQEILLEGLPLRAPMLDLATIGAGGGSIIRFDRGGALLAGPESAGVQPGPACYGRGGEAFTVTDAHLLLGHLLPDYFLGGRMQLDLAAAERAARLAMAGHMTELTNFAEGALAVAEAAMLRAIRSVSARRGYDPAQFTLLCFGGAGGLHAVRLARELGMRGVLMPPGAGTLSALGMILADTRTAAQESVLQPTEMLNEVALEARFTRLADLCRQELVTDGHDHAALIMQPYLEMRYAGQSYELQVHWSGTLIATVQAFREEHARRFGFADPTDPLEVVSAGVTASAPNPGLPLPELADAEPAQPLQHVQAWFDGQKYETAVYRLESLAPQQRITGPTILAAADSTLLLPPGIQATADRFGNIHVPLVE
jgi:N-methylhydantoinase A